MHMEQVYQQWKNEKKTQKTVVPAGLQIRTSSAWGLFRHMMIHLRQSPKSKTTRVKQLSKSM